MQSQLLHSPVEKLSDIERVFRGARYFMNPAELAGALAGLAEHTQNVAIQVHFVEAARHGIGCVEHLPGTGRNADGPGRADVGPLLDELAVGIEDLDAPVLAIADIHLAGRVGSDAVDGM